MLKRLRQGRPVFPLVIALVLLLVAAISLATLLAPKAYADRESFQLFRGPGGPYEIILGVLPHKPKVGIMHFSVSVLDPDTGQTVDDALVMVVAYDSEDEPIYQSPALQNPQEPQFYEANITFYTPGRWSLLVKVESDSKGYGEVMVPMFISPTSLDPGIEGLIVLLLIVFGISGGVLYLWWSSRRKRAAAFSH